MIFHHKSSASNKMGTKMRIVPAITPDITPTQGEEEEEENGGGGCTIVVVDDVVEKRS